MGRYLLFFILGVKAFADPLSFSEMIDIGLSNNPKTKQAWWRAKQKEGLVGIAKSAYYPDIGLNTTIINGRDFKFINGPDTNYTTLRADLALSMMLYDFGDRQASVCSAKWALIAAKWDEDFTIQLVIVKILENAYRLAYEEEVFQASLLSLADAEKMVDASEKLFHSGLNPISDIYISKSALAEMQIESVKRKNLVDIQRFRLAASMNVPFETPLPVEPLSAPTIGDLHLKELLLLAEYQRADLMQKRAEVQSSSFFYEKIKSEARPRLFFAGRGGYDYAVADKSHGAHYQVILNFDVPLFNGFQFSAQNQTAYAKIQETEQELTDLKLNAALEVLTLAKSVEAGKEMLFYAEKNLENAKKAYDGTMDKYQIGDKSIAELMNAQKQLADARILYSDIKTQILIFIANLAFATGTIGCAN